MTNDESAEYVFGLLQSVGVKATTEQSRAVLEEIAVHVAQSSFLTQKLSELKETQKAGKVLEQNRRDSVAHPLS